MCLRFFGGCLGVLVLQGLVIFWFWCSLFDGFSSLFCCCWRCLSRIDT